jgi:ribosome-associated translation inhibitor RaiA
MLEESQKSNSINATERRDGGTGHLLDATASKVEAGKPASTEELSVTVAALLKQNEALKAELQAARTTSSTDAAIDKLVNGLGELLNKTNAAPQGPTEDDNLNRSKAFSTKNQVDGQSLMDAQATLMQFRNEEKIPLSVPRTLANYVGPALAVSVNGVRVSIPADGKTYFINKSHAIAAKERIAKIERMQTDTEPNIVEIG